MTTEAEKLTIRQTGPRKRFGFRPFLLSAVVGIALLLGWLMWPSAPEPSPYDLSRADGKPRFYATTYPKIVPCPGNMPLYQRLMWHWGQFWRRQAKKIPNTYSFPPRPVQPCSIAGLLTQCMEITGKRYLVSVEVAGAVDFGHTNPLNGMQWVAALERALLVSDPVVCYDYAGKTNFLDTLVLVRERPDLVKVVPRTKLSQYQEAGLVTTGNIETGKD